MAVLNYSLNRHMGYIWHIYAAAKFVETFDPFVNHSTDYKLTGQILNRYMKLKSESISRRAWSKSLVPHACGQQSFTFANESYWKAAVKHNLGTCDEASQLFFNVLARTNQRQRGLLSVSDLCCCWLGLPCETNLPVWFCKLFPSFHAFRSRAVRQTCKVFMLFGLLVNRFQAVWPVSNHSPWFLNGTTSFIKLKAG